MTVLPIILLGLFVLTASAFGQADYSGGDPGSWFGEREDPWERQAREDEERERREEEARRERQRAYEEGLRDARRREWERERSGGVGSPLLNPSDGGGAGSSLLR